MSHSYILVASDLDRRHPQLLEGLRQLNIRLVFSSLPPDVHCIPYKGMHCVFISEAKMMENVLEIAWPPLITRLKQALLLIEQTPLSRSYYYDIQHLATIQAGLQSVPVKSPATAASLVGRLAIQDAKPPAYLKHATIVKKKKSDDPNLTLLKSVQCFPGIGEVKALTLLKHFKSLQNLMKASEADIAAVLSSHDAKQLIAFFKCSIAPAGF